MSPQPLFRFERRGRGRWDVLSGQIHLAELSAHSSNHTNPGEHWRLRAVGSETPAEAFWPANPGAGRSYRLPERVELHAIRLIAAWTLDALSEAAQSNSLLRFRLESSTSVLAEQADLLREVQRRRYGRLDYDESLRNSATLEEAIAANREALARTSTRGNEEEAA